MSLSVFANGEATGKELHAAAYANAANAADAAAAYAAAAQIEKLLTYFD